MKKYKYVVKDQHALVQQLVCGYLCREYRFCFHGKIPDKKPPDYADQKLLDEYDIVMSKDQRYRRKQKGIASIQLLRYERDFVLTATMGKHQFFKELKGQFVDTKKTSLIIFDYAISLTGDKVSVRISDQKMKELRKQFRLLATKKSAENLAIRINQQPFERYRGVILQLVSLFKLVNEIRGAGGLPKLKTSYLRDKRKLYKPFIDNHP